MLLQIIGITPATHARPLCGIHGLMGARLDGAGVRLAGRLAERLGVRIDTVFAPSFVACTETAQIVGREPHDSNVHPIEDVHFEELPFAAPYRDLYAELESASYDVFEARLGESLARYGYDTWCTMYEQIQLYGAHIGLVVAPRGLLQAMVLWGVPEKDKRTVQEAILGPCDGFSIRYSLKGHAIELERIGDMASA